MRLFDTHAHLNDERFAQDAPEAIARMRQAGVSRNVCVGSDVATSRSSIALAAEYDGLYAACGVHPHEAQAAREDDLDQIAAMLSENKVVALGEIGLDYFYDFSPRDVQREWFARQLELAFSADMPVILHIRDAHGEALRMLSERRGRLPGGIVHCYSGSAESAREYLAMGFYISFSGSVTFKNARGLREAARTVPPERLLIETDSPYLSPEPVRGRRNEPANVAHVLSALADTLNADPNWLAEQTYQNACRVYRLPDDGESRLPTAAVPCASQREREECKP